MGEETAGTGAEPTVTVSDRGNEPRDERLSVPMRWGIWVAHHRWWVLAVWAVLVVVAVLAYPHLMRNLSAADYSVTGSDSAEVAELIESDFSSAGAEQDVIVFDSATLVISDPDYAETVDRVLASVRGQPGVASVVGPTDIGAQGQVSADGRSALATLGLSGDDRERATRAADLQDVIASAAGSGPVQAYLTGYSPAANDLTEVENADVERAESIGIPVAFIVLIVALGAVVSAFIPLLTAVISLLFTFGILSSLITLRPIDSFLLSIVTMIGVGISIDYSLFVLSRYREELARAHAEGREDAVAWAVGVAMSTSGRTILFSGSIVAISLFSLFVVNAPLFHGMATGSVLVVVCTLVTAWTMLPALLAALGDRVNRWALPKRFRPTAGNEGASPGESGSARWARTVLAHPWLALPAVAILLLFALPTLGIELGIDLGLAAISDTPSGKAEVILAEKFSPGLLSPIEILASHDGSGELSADDLTTIEKLTNELAQDPRVDYVYSVSVLLDSTIGEVSPEGLDLLAQDPEAATYVEQVINVDKGSDRTIITVVSKDPIDSTAATDLVRDLRNDIIPSYAAAAGPEMLVGGSTAQFEDLGEETLSKLPVVMTIVLTLSFLYLMVIFRSLLIPAKAVAMNLLTTFAAFGLTTWVFVDGHLEALFDFTSVGFVQTFLPIMVFALVFGLSMDYEVFLMGRMREHWLKTYDNDEAVVVGIAHTARVITAAALIMAAVFGCFIVADVLELKEFGFALATAVVLDATIVRMLLVPAIMKLAGGKANWWLPGSLDRILPRIRVD